MTGESVKPYDIQPGGKSGPGWPMAPGTPSASNAGASAGPAATVSARVPMATTLQASPRGAAPRPRVWWRVALVILPALVLGAMLFMFDFGGPVRVIAGVVLVITLLLLMSHTTLTRGVHVEEISNMAGGELRPYVPVRPIKSVR